jgi:hypothetical protein
VRNNFWWSFYLLMTSGEIIKPVLRPCFFMTKCTNYETLITQWSKTSCLHHVLFITSKYFCAEMPAIYCLTTMWDSKFQHPPLPPKYIVIIIFFVYLVFRCYVGDRKEQNSKLHSGKDLILFSFHRESTFDLLLPFCCISTLSHFRKIYRLYLN